MSDEQCTLQMIRRFLRPHVTLLCLPVATAQPCVISPPDISLFGGLRHHRKYSGSGRCQRGCITRSCREFWTRNSKAKSKHARKQEVSVTGSRNCETCRSASCFTTSLMQSFSNYQQFPCGIPLFEKLFFPCASIGFPTSSTASIVPGLDCSFRAEKKN